MWYKYSRQFAPRDPYWYIRKRSYAPHTSISKRLTRADPYFRIRYAGSFGQHTPYRGLKRGVPRRIDGFLAPGVTFGFNLADLVANIGAGQGGAEVVNDIPPGTTAGPDVVNEDVIEGTASTPYTQWLDRQLETTAPTQLDLQLGISPTPDNQLVQLGVAHERDELDEFNDALASMGRHVIPRYS